MKVIKTENLKRRIWAKIIILIGKENSVQMQLLCWMLLLFFRAAGEVFLPADSLKHVVVAFFVQPAFSGSMEHCRCDR